MFSLNRMTMQGSVGQDPQINALKKGGRVASFSVRTTDSYKDQNTGEYVLTQEWHNVVVFYEPLIKQIEKDLKKGSTVYVEGKMQTRSYQNKTHSDVKHNIVETVVSGNGGKVLFDRPDNTNYENREEVENDDELNQYHDG